jgi:hypothetical protein
MLIAADEDGFSVVSSDKLMHMLPYYSLRFKLFVIVHFSTQHLIIRFMQNSSDGG